MMRISRSPLSSLPWIAFYFWQITNKSLARCCFWPPALTAAYVFQVSVQSRKGHLQGNPICSTKKVPAPHHKSHGWPSGEERHSTRWAPGCWGTRWHRTQSSTQPVFSKTIGTMASITPQRHGDGLVSYILGQEDLAKDLGVCGSPLSRVLQFLWVNVITIATLRREKRLSLGHQNLENSFPACKGNQVTQFPNVKYWKRNVTCIARKII